MDFLQGFEHAPTEGVLHVDLEKIEACCDNGCSLSGSLAAVNSK
jgi:hypothetical protein